MISVKTAFEASNKGPYKLHNAKLPKFDYPPPWKRS